MTTLFEQAAPRPVVLIEYPELFAEPQPAPAEDSVAVDWGAVAAADEAAVQARVDQARAAGYEAARAEFEERTRDIVEVERTALTMACTGFGKARARYFEEIEAEVVKLALSIAARVLHREVRSDPTLLAGVVRVALSRLSSLDGACLQVPPEELDLWRRAMKSSGLAVEEDSRLAEGELQLKTTGGVAELGIEAQLVEVERGFCDLLAKRPA